MLTASLKNKYKKYEEKSQLRERISVASREENTVIVGENECVNFCNNDYLGLSVDLAVKKSFIDGVNKYGVGSGASALVSGYFDVQKKLEERFAEYLQRDRAILFSSGYTANIGVLTSLVDRSGVVLSDKHCHASLLDGVQLSRAKHYRYRHNDAQHLSELAESKSPHLIVTESVFSMQGDVAPLKEMCETALASNAKLMVDDAHGVGVCDLARQFNKEIDCLVTPLGKAFGAVGAVVSGSENLVESCLQFARTYRYTTALPPAISCALLTSLEIFQKEKWRKEKLIKLVEFFISQSKKNNIILMSEEITPIKCVLVSGNDKAIIIQQKMLDKGFFVSCIRPPTVPEGKARIRISLNCLHTEKQIEQMLNALGELL